MEISRESNRLIPNWFCKEVSSGQLINYTSAHPPKMKFNTALSFADKVIHLSHPRYHDENRTKIQRILRKNNYPQEIIDKILKRTRNRKPQPQSSQEKPDMKHQRIPYAPIIGDKIAKQITRVDPSIQVAHAPINHFIPVSITICYTVRTT